jgi:hypothetical protein
MTVAKLAAKLVARLLVLVQFTGTALVPASDGGVGTHLAARFGACIRADEAFEGATEAAPLFFPAEDITGECNGNNANA